MEKTDKHILLGISLLFSLSIHFLVGIFYIVKLSKSPFYNLKQKSMKPLQKKELNLIHIKLSSSSLPMEQNLKNYFSPSKKSPVYIHKTPDKVLNLIYQQIESVWKNSLPPEPGKIKVRLFLKRNGEVKYVDILTNSGSWKLEKFIISVINRASPFTALHKLTTEDEIVVDCIFKIK